jgi:hypothetical protein
MLPFVLSLPDPNVTLKVATNGLQPRILKMLEPVDAAPLATLETASQAIGRLFVEAFIPEEIERAFRAGYETLGACPPLSPMRQFLLLCVPRRQPVIILRNRKFDCYARDFLARHPNAVVVHIGCGLDSRFERVAERSGQVEWYDLDFPHVIELRRKFIGDERERYHLLGCSVLDNAWLKVVSAHQQRPFLFLAEGVSMHLEEAQIKWLVLALRDRFPGAELVFDAYSPAHLWVSNLQSAGAGFRCHWGLWRGQEIEGWGAPSTSLACVCAAGAGRAGGTLAPHEAQRSADVRLLDEWGFFDQPEPRMDSYRWMAPIFRLFKPMRIFHFQLGKAVR